MEKPETTRGVRLSDLDRSKAYVIAYRGRRWEVVGPVEPPREGESREPG